MAQKIKLVAIRDLISKTKDTDEAKTEYILLCIVLAEAGFEVEEI